MFRGSLIFNLLNSFLRVFKCNFILSATVFSVVFLTAQQGFSWRSNLGFWKNASCLSYGSDINVNGSVNTVFVQDDVIYLGGTFTQVQGVSRTNVAAINASGTVLSFNPRPSSTVNSITASGSVVYLGGSFDRVGDWLQGRGACYDNLASAFQTDFPAVNGVIYASAYDGLGGWYIGGAFTQVGGINRSGLAHINSDMTVDLLFSADTTNVFSLKLSGSTLYVGGNFISIQGQSRLSLASISTITNTVNAFKPETDGIVRDMVVSGTTLYVGGNFDTIGGVRRKNLAQVDTITASATAWIPPYIDNTVYSLTADTSSIYAGGSFLNLNYMTGSYGNVVDLASGNLLNHSKFTCVGACTDPVSVSISDGQGGWYVGGSFDLVDNNSNYKYVARIKSDGFLDNAFKVNPSNPVRALALSGSTLFIGGSFTTVSGTARSRLAAVDANTGNLLAGFNANSISAIVNTITASGSTLYFGGNFTTVSGTARNRLAAVDMATGNLVAAFNPNMNGVVNSLAVSGSALYVGGNFTTVSGTTRSRLAAVDAITGDLITGFNANTISNAVNAIAVSGSALYLGGNFSTVNGTTRNYLAAVDGTTGSLLSFNPNMSALVNSIFINGTTLYAGGAFSTVGGVSRPYLAGIDLGTGLLTAFNKSANSTINTAAISSGSILFGGVDTITNNTGSSTRNYLASVSVATGIINSFNPLINDIIYSSVLSGATLYVGGSFTTINATGRNRLAALDTSTGNLIPAFDPNMNATVYALALSGTTLYAGGDFTTVGAVSKKYLTSVDTVTQSLGSMPALPNNSVYTLLANNNKVFLGGAFTFLGGTEKNYLVGLDKSTSLPTVFNFQTNAAVRSLLMSNNTLFLGGDFTNVSGTSRTYLGSIDISTAAGSLNSFNPTIDAPLSALAVSGSTLYVGGDSKATDLGNDVYSYTNKINFINATTGAILQTSTLANSVLTENPVVNTLSVQDNMLYAGGFFTSYAGQSRTHLAALNATTAAVLPFAPSLNNQVQSTALFNNKLYVGGNFTSVSGSNRASVEDLITGAEQSPILSADATVRAIAVSGTTLFLGGDFTTFGGSSNRKRLVILKTKCE